MKAVITKSPPNFENFVVSYLSETGDEIGHIDRVSKKIESKSGMMFLMVDSMIKAEGYRFTGYKLINPYPDEIDEILEHIGRQVVIDESFAATKHVPLTVWEPNFWFMNWFRWQHETANIGTMEGYALRQADYFARLICLSYPIDQAEAKRIADDLKVQPVQVITNLSDTPGITAQIVLRDSPTDRAFFYFDGSNWCIIAEK